MREGGLLLASISRAVLWKRDLKWTLKNKQDLDGQRKPKMHFGLGLKEEWYVNRNKITETQSIDTMSKSSHLLIILIILEKERPLK